MSNTLTAPALETRPVVQELNPLVTYDPYIQKAHNEQMSTICKIVPIASLAIGMIAAHLLFGTKSPWPFLFSAHVTYDIIHYHDVLYDEEVKFNKQLIEHMSYLDPANMQSQLKQLGVTAGHMSTENLMGLMARYNIYEEKKRLQTSSREAGAYTVAMAYLLKLIETPEEKRPIEGFCTLDYKFDPVRGKFVDRDYLFWQVPGHTRRIKTDTKTYDLWKLNYKSPVELSKEIFGLNPAPEKSSWFSCISWLC